MGCAHGKAGAAIEHNDPRAYPPEEINVACDSDVKGCFVFRAKAAHSATHGRHSATIAILAVRAAPDVTPSLERSDPCCVCEIPGKSDCFFSTIIIRGQSSQPWNHKAVFDGCVDGDDLVFAVRDKAIGFLGSAILPTDQFLEAGFDGELPLVVAREGVKAYLRVQVRTERDDTASAGGETSSTRSCGSDREVRARGIAEPMGLTGLAVPLVPPVPQLEGHAYAAGVCDDTACFCR
mmetsp:Transcript_52271/g.144764  ORF Transcript_52271/g.144764 Transcript_52271/m.144764 type:complete len:236 (-) Transcript_52271:181-888(-)